jgi:hypothetical protein
VSAGFESCRGHSNTTSEIILGWTGNRELPDDDHVVSGSPGVIASGLFTAPAADHEHPKTGAATFVFANGTVNVRHSPG